MKLNQLISIATGIMFFTLAPANAQVKPERQWPAYRGYMSSGVLDDANLPETFNSEKSINIKWKIALPGLGHSSPVIWDDKLFVTTAVSLADNKGIKSGIFGDGMPVPDSSVHDWKVYCIDKYTGKTIWERTAYTGVPKIKRHPKSTHANPSVATDGNYVVAFLGSEGLYCYDFETGKEIWRMSGGGDVPIPTPIIGKDLIYFNSAHGTSSPILAVKADE